VAGIVVQGAVKFSNAVVVVGAALCVELEAGPNVSTEEFVELAPMELGSKEHGSKHGTQGPAPYRLRSAWLHKVPQSQGHCTTSATLVPHSNRK
jgi:hypothetical protein